ncbi:MAG TPA: type IV pilus assembly protein PilM [Patescibacteria group bacterium]|nr:type IV pilus assembly protein PilM [Patescibacteria group bacterium]
MKSKLVGLDIGSNTIKIASLKQTGQSYFIESIAQAPTTPRGMMSDAIADLGAIGEVIKQLFVSSGIKNREVSLCLPENLVYTKVIEMPQLSLQELSAALKFEMEQYIPLPIEKVKTDWQILGSNDDEGRHTMNVMIIAAPTSVLDKYQKVMDYVGLTAESIETEITAVHRSLSPLLTASTFTNMIVHIGATATTIAIIRAGIIKMVFSINVGGVSLTRSISIELGIDMVQAENYKKAYGLNPNAFEGKIARVLEPVLRSVVGDIKKAILSFREKYNNESIKQVILSGGSALLPGIDVMLTNALSTQVVLGNSIAAYNIQNAPSELQVEVPSYNVVFGLALRNLI